MSAPDTPPFNLEIASFVACQPPGKENALTFFFFQTECCLERTNGCRDIDYQALPRQGKTVFYYSFFTKDLSDILGQGAEDDTPMF